MVYLVGHFEIRMISGWSRRLQVLTAVILLRNRYSSLVLALIASDGVFMKHKHLLE